MSNNFMSYEDANTILSAYASAIKSGGGGGGWNPHFVIPSDTGETVTVVKGQTTITAVETSEGIYECDIPSNNYGDWTVNIIVDGTAKQKVVPVNVVQIYFINYIDGRTVTPVNDIDTLLKCADICNAEGIETISDVLADDTILLTVISSNNAVDYLKRSTNFASDMCADQTTMNYIGLDNYASDTLLSDTTWRTAICNSSYFERVLNTKVPVMTSNNTPSGTCFGDAGTYYTPFDGNDSSWWSTSGYGTGGGHYVGYSFPNPVKVYMCKTVTSNSGDSAYLNLLWKNFKIQGASYGSEWVNLYTGVNPKQFNITQKFVLSNVDEYQYYRFYAVDIYGASNTYYVGMLGTLQFYGRTDV